MTSVKVKASGRRWIFINSTNICWRHADTILLNPAGAVAIQGFGLYTLYFKSALDKFNLPRTYSASVLINRL